MSNIVNEGEDKLDLDTGYFTRKAFTVGSKETELYEETVTKLIKDTKSNLTDEISKLRTQNRVIYGPTLQSSAENPEYMLYEIVNETGYVRPIPNTTFTKNTPWVKEGLAAYAEKLEKERAERAPFIIPLLGAATGPIPEGIINE